MPRHDLRHGTAEVTAETLLEVVAQGLRTIRGNGWVAGIGHGIVKVSVAHARVEQAVNLQDFTKWLERPNGSPRDVIQRKKIRGILRMPGMR
jgi:hypothetical protein